MYMFHWGLYVTPLLLGRYPEEFEASVAPSLRGNDLAAIGRPLDSLGINYYNPSYVRCTVPGSPVPFEEARRTLEDSFHWYREMTAAQRDVTRREGRA